MTTRHIHAKADRRTTPERQVAKALSVTIDFAQSDVRSVYGSTQRYAQIFVTTLGEKLVIVADDKHVSGSLLPASFDWDEDIANEEQNYRNIASAAGLEY